MMRTGILPTFSGKMSMSHERPPYGIKVARTRDEVEACYDIRIEGR